MNLQGPKTEIVEFTELVSIGFATYEDSATGGGVSRPGTSRLPGLDDVVADVENVKEACSGIADGGLVAHFGSRFGSSYDSLRQIHRQQAPKQRHRNAPARVHLSSGNAASECHEQNGKQRDVARRVAAFICDCQREMRNGHGGGQQDEAPVLRCTSQHRDQHSQTCEKDGQDDGHSQQKIAQHH